MAIAFVGCMKYCYKYMKCCRLLFSLAVSGIVMKGFVEGETGRAVGEVDCAAGGEAEFQGGMLHGAVVGVGVEA